MSTFKNINFKQLCGIGMGTIYSIIAVNLSYYEYKYTVNFSRKFNIFGMSMTFLFAYYDLYNEYSKMYPDCLQLNKANISYNN